MDTRLLRVHTSDAVPGSVSENGAAFTINLGNVLSQIQADVYGYSVESVGFYNWAKNVQLNISDRITTSYNNVFTELVIPPGQYNFASALVALQAQVLAGYGALVEVIEDPLKPGHLQWKVGGNVTFIVYGNKLQNSNTLATLFGAIQRVTFTIVSPMFVITTGTLPNHVDFGGERVAFLHSDSLTHNKHSIDGEGLALSHSCSFPVYAFYGDYNLAYPNQYRSSVVTWDQTHEIREIQLRLRTIRGDLFDLQGTEWFVVLRLFLI